MVCLLLSKKIMKNKKKEWVLSGSINRHNMITKYIECNMNKLSSDESKLSYIDEMRIKHKINKGIYEFLIKLSDELGYEKSNAKWVKKEKNILSGL